MLSLCQQLSVIMTLTVNFGFWQEFKSFAFGGKHNC